MYGKRSTLKETRRGGRGERTICLTTSAVVCRSMRRLWILISNRSQVLEPSPQGLRWAKKNRESMVWSAAVGRRGEDKGKPVLTTSWW
jgi:hypothetical protein